MKKTKEVIKVRGFVSASKVVDEERPGTFGVGSQESRCFKQHPFTIGTPCVEPTSALFGFRTLPDLLICLYTQLAKFMKNRADTNLA